MFLKMFIAGSSEFELGRTETEGNLLVLIFQIDNIYIGNTELRKHISIL